MMARILRLIVRILGFAVALIVVAAVVFVIVFDVESYREEIAARASEAAGRPVAIEGEMALEWGFTPVLVLNQVRLGEEGDSLQATVDQVTVTAALFPLILGTVDVLEMRADGARMDVDAGGDILSNLAPPAEDTASQDDGAVRAPGNLPPIIVRDSTIHLHRTSGDATLGVDEARIDAGEPTLLTASGSYNGARWQLNATLPPVLSGRGGAMEARLALAGATVSLTGPVTVSRDGRVDVDVDLALDADDLTGLGSLLGLSLAAVPPIQVDAGLVGGTGRLDANNFILQVGGTRVTGDATIQLSGARPRITAELSMDRVDLSAFGTPDPPDGGMPSPRVLFLPTATDLSLTVSVVNLALPGRTVGPVSARFNTNAEGVTVDAEARGVMNGLFQIRMRAEPTAAGLSANGDVLFTGFDLAQFFGPWAIGSGRLDARLSGQGDSLENLIPALTGELSLASGDAVIDIGQLLNQAAGAPGLLGGLPARLDVTCAYGDLTVSGLTWQSRELALATELGPVGGQAAVDWADRRLDLVLRPDPDFPLAEVAARPVRIAGRFGAPSVSLSDEGILEQGGELILGTIETLTLPLPDLSEASSAATACREALQRAE
jgi:hypothetical protein